MTRLSSVNCIERNGKLIKLAAGRSFYAPPIVSLTSPRQGRPYFSREVPTWLSGGTGLSVGRHQQTTKRYCGPLFPQYRADLRGDCDQVVWSPQEAKAGRYT
ncbi:hypothetical protein ACLOJK_002801 [Asimina triloba]